MQQLKNTLFYIHKPPPRHGTAVIGEQIERYMENDSNYFFNLSLSGGYQDVGKINLTKVNKLIKLIYYSLYVLILRNIRTVYIGVSLNGGGLWRDLVFIALAKLARKYLVIHIHTRVSREPRFLRKYLIQWLFMKCKCIVPSHSVKQDLIKHNICTNPSVVPNGIEPIAVRGKRLLSDDRKSHILYYSNFSINKGIYVFLEIISKLDCTENIHVMIFGSELGITLEMINMRAEKLGLTCTLEICSGPTEDQKKDMWSRADILIFPSLDEAFGLVCIEAMASGTLVIASQEGGITDVIKNGFNGLTFKTGEPGDGCQKLQLALTDRFSSQRLAEQGNRDYFDKFHVSKFILNLKKSINNK